MQMNLKVVCRGKDESCFIFKSLVEFLLEPLKYDFKDYAMEEKPIFVYIFLLEIMHDVWK